MNILFWLALLFIFLCIPPLFISLILFFVSKYYLNNLSYRTNGYLKYSDIHFYIDSPYFFLSVALDHFQIYFIWLRLRINFSGLKINLCLKNKLSSLVKSNPISKHDFAESFIIKKPELKSREGNNSIDNGEYRILEEIKDKFFKIIQERYISKHIKKDTYSNTNEEEFIDNIVKKSDISKQDKFLRNLLVFFDFLVENVEMNFKLSENDFYHSFAFRKLIIGGIKGLNKHKEVHFVCILFDLELKEYVSTMNEKYRMSLNNNPKDVCNGCFINPFAQINPQDPATYTEFLLMENKKLFLNIKLEYGLFPVTFLSLMNTLNIKADLTKTNVEISARCINTLLKLMNHLIKFNKYNTRKQNTEQLQKKKSSVLIQSDAYTEFSIECVEEAILSKINSLMKKIKIKLNEVEIRILSDNHNYIYSFLHFSNLTLQTKNVFNYYYDSTKLRLLKSNSEVKMVDLQVTSHKKEKLILDLQTFTFSISEDIIYYHTSREAHIHSTSTSETPNMQIIMTTKELDKIIEIIVCVVCGMEKMEAISERNFCQYKYIEIPSCQSNLNLNFENVNMIVHDEKIQGELNNLAVIVKIEEQKHVGAKVDVIFSPVNLNVFRKYSTKYSSNIIVKGFKLNILDDLKTSHIDVVFAETKVVVYDDHLIDALKFVADFLTYNLRNSVKRKYKIQIQQGEKKINPNKKETTNLLFKKVIVYYFVDFDDIFTLKIYNYNFLIDDWMLIPVVKIYHQCTTRKFLKNRTLALSVEKFYIKFHPEINELYIEFGPIILNCYCFELCYPIMTMFIYHHFFPLWIIYHMNYKYRVDEDYKLIYIAEFAKKDKLMIKFENIIVKINQHLISSVGILQTNPMVMIEQISKMDAVASNNDLRPVPTCSSRNILHNEQKTSSSEIHGDIYSREVKYLNSIKCDQVTLKVHNFVISTSGYYEKETNKEDAAEVNENRRESGQYNDDDYFFNSNINRGSALSKNVLSKPYYKRITKKGHMEMTFETIDILHENSKIVELVAFKIILGDTCLYDKFDLQKLNSIACTYKMHSIFYKEIKSRKTKHAYVEIYIDNLKVFLDDIKIIDKISLLSMNIGKTIMAYPFQEKALVEIMDTSKLEQHNILSIFVNNFQTVVNSLDPITNEIYSQLYLKIDSLVMSKEEGPGYDRMQVSTYYLTFGFDFSSSNDYPLISIPLCELNIDGSIIRLNVPYNSLRRRSGSNRVEKACPVSKLDKFILDTKSLTLFLNFSYLNTFHKIFENFWKRSDFVKRYYMQGNKSEPQSFPENNNIPNISMTRLSPINKSATFMTNEIDYSLCAGLNLNPYINEEDSKSKLQLFANQKESSENKLKLLLTIFDVKIIYLLKYKEEYATIFKFHSDIQERGFFGYTIRLYSMSLKYSVNLCNTLHPNTPSNQLGLAPNLANQLKFDQIDELKVNWNLFTISFLNDENFEDEKFFKYDKEIKFSRFYNLKMQKNFNDFMEMPSRKFKMINDNFMKFFEVDEEGNDSILTLKKDEPEPSPKIGVNSSTRMLSIFPILTSKAIPSKIFNDTNDKSFIDLIFDHKNTLIKIFDINFKRDTLNIRRIEEIYITVNDMKITWNKINMDVTKILLFEDVLQIVDKIILKCNTGDNKMKTLDTSIVSSKSIIKPKQQQSALDLTRFNFIFELNEPQICIQNEIKNSKVLLTTKSKCKLKISKISVNENSKDLRMEFQLKDMALYIAPNYMGDNCIYWIGDNEENMYYLDEKLFNLMLATPNINFLILETIKSHTTVTQCPEETANKAENVYLYTNMSISVDKLIADFGNQYFNHFMNIIEVFIFDRGYSYAEEKISLDSRDKDLQMFRLEDIKNKIKMKIVPVPLVKQKEITFSLKDVVLTLMKENKEIIKLLMRKFEGEHIIFTDKSSETSINVKNLKILDLLKNKNETILSPNVEMKNIGEYEDKRDLIIFRRKDSYVSIGTDSKWYVLNYLELVILPLYINMSKSQCDFILEFFFNGTSENMSEEDYKKLLISGGGKPSGGSLSVAKKHDDDKGIGPSSPHQEKNEINYPIYFKEVKVNETRLNITFFLSESSPFNLNNAKVKFSQFEKKDKFYTDKVLICRLIHHLKMLSFKNVGNLLASIFFTEKKDVVKKKKDDEEEQRKMLFGSQYSK